VKRASALQVRRANRRPALIAADDRPHLRRLRRECLSPLIPAVMRGDAGVLRGLLWWWRRLRSLI